MDQQVLGGLYKAAGVISIGVGVYLLRKGQVIQEVAKLAVNNSSVILDAVFEVVEESQ